MYTTPYQITINSSDKPLQWPAGKNRLVTVPIHVDVTYVCTDKYVTSNWRHTDIKAQP